MQATKFICGISAGLLLLANHCSRATAQDDLTIVIEQPLTGTTPIANDGDWPWWRGPGVDNHSHDADLPITWSPTENVRWQAPVPGRGHSSPIVCEDRIFLTTANETEEQQLLLCYDRATGRQLWDKLLHEGGFMRCNRKNSFASATPACDGESVYTAFINHDALWVTAVDFDGNILWQSQAGEFTSQHGYGPSPLLYRSAVIVSGDNWTRSYLAALDRATGEIVWRTPRDNMGKFANFGTPIVATTAGKPQLLLAGHQKVTSYDPETGELNWWCSGPSRVAGCTMAYTDTMVFASGGFPEKELMALHSDGSGDVTSSHVVWRTGKGVAYVPSPIVHEDLLYVVSDGGVCSCHRAVDGEEVWRERLDGQYTASPVIADGKIYLTNEIGVTSVLRVGERFELLAKNDLGSGGMASPVICGGVIYLRTGESLYAIATAQ